MSDKVLAVLTGKSRERLLKEGGTSDWVLTPGKVRNFKHVVCVRHGHPPYDPGPGSRPEPHGAAFLVATIADVKFTYTDEDSGRDRYLVTFGSIVDVLAPNFWDGSRSPVRYLDVSEVKARGIDLETLNFLPFEAPRPVEAKPEGVEALTIMQAKQGLSAMFGVPTEAIEITIRG